LMSTRGFAGYRMEPDGNATIMIRKGRAVLVAVLNHCVSII
jgi:hypothetical protein